MKLNLATITVDKVSHYKNPADLSAEEIISLENAYVDCEANVSKIAVITGLHYTTVYRYIKRQFNADGKRSDKGKSRKLSIEQLKTARKSFDYFFCLNAQKNVTLAVESVQKDTGILIPQRVSYQWAGELNGVHTMKHYYKEFISRHTPYIRRDLWGEVENFMDIVASDVWKIDDPFITEDGERATAYAITFQDVKTRYPLEIVIAPHSVSAADVKKGMMAVISNWGKPKQWLLDNGDEFINTDNINFLYGVHKNVIENDELSINDKIVMLKESEELVNSRPYYPRSKGAIERTFRILKDEWAAFSISYSPNQFDSRKPGVELSSVMPEQTFAQLRESLHNFVYGDFLTRERSMFVDPLKSTTHDDNKDRPKTIEDAFNRAYAIYAKCTVDPYVLAYYYQEKRYGTFNGAMISFVDKVSKLKLYYIPDKMYDESFLPTGRVTCLLDPQNIFRCWVFQEDRLVCEAKDMRFDENTGLTRDRAAVIGKLQNKIVKLNKDKARKIEQYNKELSDIKRVEIKPKEEIFNSPFDEYNEPVNVVSNDDDDQSDWIFNNLDDEDIL